ncbi:MAG: ATP-binding protein [Actinomycetota bacterium]|nr:ATP-binding protein [Actinomycetota bacterium]
MSTPRLSLAGRVALAAALVAAVVVLAAGLTAERLVARDQRAELETDIERAARLAPAIARIAGRSGPAAEVIDDLDTRIGYVVLDGDGEVVATFGTTPDPPIASSGPGTSTVRADGERWRVRTVDVREGLLGGGAASVQVAASMADLDASLRSIRRRLVTVGGLAVAAAALGGLAAGQAAARPLRRLRDDAARVRGTADLGMRVPLDQGPAEVDEVAGVLNDMLGRLESETARTAAALEGARGFAAAAAHELRTPLTVMRTNVDVLARHADLDEAERATVLGELAVEHERLLRLLDALRLLARGDLAAAEPSEPLDLAELADVAVDAARRRHPDARIVLVAEGDHTVVGWPEGLRVLVDNLLENAANHGRSADGSLEVRVSVHSEATTTWLVVDDRGPGVPPQLCASIFERFRRASHGPGSGLGLALVAQQAELHGGSAHVEDAPGGGARFVVSLDRTRRGPFTSHRPDPPEPPSARRPAPGAPPPVPG